MKKSEPDSGDEQFDPSRLPEIEEKYLKAFPDVSIPINLRAQDKFAALIQSKGRKIIFVEQHGIVKFFFEDQDEENDEIRNFKKLIGCGG